MTDAWDELVARLEPDADGHPSTAPAPADLELCSVLLDVGAVGDDAPAIRGVWTTPGAGDLAWAQEVRRLEIIDWHEGDDLEALADEFHRAGGSVILRAAAYRDAESGRRRALLLMVARLDG